MDITLVPAGASEMTAKQRIERLEMLVSFLIMVSRGRCEGFAIEAEMMIAVLGFDESDVRASFWDFRCNYLDSLDRRRASRERANG